MSKKYLFIVLSFFMGTNLVGQIPTIDLPSFTLNDVKIQEITTANYAQIVRGNYQEKRTKQDTTAVDSTKGITFIWSEESTFIGITLNLSKAQVKLGNVIIKNMMPINKLNLPPRFTIGSAFLDETQKILSFLTMHPERDGSGITLTSRVLTQEEFDYFKKNSEWGRAKYEKSVNDKAWAIEIETIQIGCNTAPPQFKMISRE
jgi:hypothetical protein